MPCMARPKTLDDAKRKMVSLPAPLAQAIEDYRFSNRLKTEAEAIRRLIEAGLRAYDKGAKPPRSNAAPLTGGTDARAERAGDAVGQ